MAEGFDLIEPSLIQQLKKILDQYPDDGQILKELIQNAEDAGATHVKFLHDKHSYGTEQLYNEDLADFQGPALYAYNNAQFSKEDWEGIRMVSDSIKVEDPMKVGRFGLGFKSVFHITDLPSLLSESQIGFIDPHGFYFSDRLCRRTGKLWRLQEDHMDMNKIPEQFLPYKGIFDCTDEVFSEGYYNGTLFRFPLRSKPSQLSETLYSADKMKRLFESFKADAHLMLLFLQHLESIELYVREESESKPRKVFQVKVAEKSLPTVRVKREEFRRNIRFGEVMPASVTVTYPITLETVHFDSPFADSKKQHSFLVTSYFCGGQVSSTFKKLMTDKVLSYLPTVGVAMALPTGPKLQTPTIQGHVFCFLPLPVQKTSLTGLPVHVNGFFALSQNRRYIKSPNAEQEDQERKGQQLTDKSLLWNKCLLEEAIPRAYATMILEAIEEKSVFVPTASIYKAWPDVKRIDHKWGLIAEPFFKILLQKEIVYTEASRGKWVAVKQALFDRLSDSEPKELLQKVMLAASYAVVSVPSHVMKVIADRLTFTEITAHVTRVTLKGCPECYKDLDRREKLLLLRFCLRDCQFTELYGLDLLPLTTGAFTTFSKQPDRIYISSPEHPKELLPGLRHRFLDDTVEADIIQKLRDAAKQECTQLRLLGKDDVALLLQRALPTEWSEGKTVLWYPRDKNHNHPPEDWIKLVWKYLRDHFKTPKSMQRLANLPLIPLSLSQRPVILTRLCNPSTVVVKSLNDGCIDEALTDVLTKLGLIVSTDCPTFITNHPAVWGSILNRISVQGVLKAMVVSSTSMGAGNLSEVLQRNVSTEGKRVLRSFLADVRSWNIGVEERKLLCSLPVFETLFKRFVSKNDGLCAAPLEPLPIATLRELVDISQDDSKKLAVLLNVRVLKLTEFLCDVIFPDIQQRKYPEEQIDKLMSHVLKHLAHLICTDVNFKRNMQALSFVPKQNQRVRASDLFDPRNDFLKKIFANENVFPIGALYNEPTVLVMLEELGMKKERSVTAGDLFQSAKQVKKLPHLPTAKQKSEAIFQYLSSHPQKLREPVNGEQLGALLRNIRWVSRLRQRTPNFPASLSWWGTDEEEERHFFKPAELKSHQLVNLLGTVMPVVHVQPSSAIANYFGWQVTPDVFNVVEHLRNVIASYCKEDKPFYMVVVNEIYSFLKHTNCDAVNQVFHQSEVFEWVWNGDGFSSPNQILSSKPPIDLTPYMFPLPSEMLQHSNLFHRFGMREQSDPDVLLQVLGMMKEKYDSGNLLPGASDAKHDLQLAVDILNEVASKELSSELKEKVLLPTHYPGDFYVRLQPVERCMYCEHEDWLKLEVDDGDKQYFYVHPNVPIVTAERLNVPSRTNRMLDPDELFTGEEFGQEERLTTVVYEKSPRTQRRNLG